MKVKIERHWGDFNQTLGACTVFNGAGMPVFSALSLERGWNDNQPRISSIPKGKYRVVLEWSEKFQRDLWEIKGVVGRSETKFHSANYWFQLNGCIALGLKLKKINSDAYFDITNSKNTMSAFHDALRSVDEFYLEIV